MDPVTGAVIGKVVDFGLSKLGGGEKRPRYRDALQAQIYATENDINTKMKMAKQHGIHPLMMLGAPSASAPTPHIASSSGFQSLAGAGSDISRAISAGHTTNLEKLQERLLAAQIEGQEIDNVSRASQLARTHAAGSAPHASSLAAQKDAISKMDTPFGRTQGGFPLHKTAYDEQGNAIRLFNEGDLGDNDWAQLVHLLRYSIPDAAANYTRPMRRAVGRHIERNKRFWSNKQKF